MTVLLHIPELETLEKTLEEFFKGKVEFSNEYLPNGQKRMIFYDKKRKAFSLDKCEKIGHEMDGLDIYFIKPL